MHVYIKFIYSMNIINSCINEHCVLTQISNHAIYHCVLTQKLYRILYMATALKKKKKQFRDLF